MNVTVWLRDRKHWDRLGKCDYIIQTPMYHLPDEALVSVAPPTNLPVQSPRSEESRVQNIRSVGGHDELDLAQPVKPVHLVQQLHESSLDLSVS